jgi:hypothetical protein
VLAFRQAFFGSVDNQLLVGAATCGIACGIIPRCIVVVNSPLVVTSRVIHFGCF